MPHYDALLLVSFGGPEQPEDVMPFLENVVRGRNVPRERLELVAKHYLHFGGVSPINAQNRQLLEALRLELKQHGIDLPLYFGNRNWHPFLADTVERMTRDGIRRALALITSAYSSYSGCRQYREDIQKARRVVPGAPEIDPLRRFFNHPGFLEAWLDRLRSTLQQIPAERRAHTQLVFTAHSLPMSSALSCDYGNQLRANAEWLGDQSGQSQWALVWQSRSGAPHVPWLEPDILNHLRAIAEAGARDVVIAPIGFVSDHMEVRFDLDVEARQLCDELGLTYHRVASVSDHPRFVSGIRELITERLSPNLPRKSLGVYPPRADECAVDCCPAPQQGRA